MIRDTRQSVRHIVAMLGVFILGICASPVAAQVVPWQQPPGASQTDQADTSDRSAESKSPDHSPAPWESEGYEQEGTPLGLSRGALPDMANEIVHNRIWVRGEFLAWWTKGFATPPLLTTSPPGTDQTQAGVLGAANTSVLFGGQAQAGGFHPGERISLGAWLTREQTFGLEASYLQISRQTEFFNASGVTVPILARPFFNAQTGLQDSQIVTFPGQQGGTFSSAVSSELQIAEFLFRKNLFNQPDLQVDFVTGYRYQQLEDHLAVDDSLSFSGTQSGFPAGSTVQQSDRFDTRNVFQGGVLGMSTSLHRQRWTIDTSLKFGIGDTRSRVEIVGATTTAVPGQATTLLPGGLLALPGNIGVHDSNQFSVVPELNLSVGFDFTPQVRATIGYDMVYWNSVARPGDQIDLNVDPRQLPPAISTNATLPAYQLHTSDYWAQGLNLGLDVRF